MGYRGGLKREGGLHKFHASKKGGLIEHLR